MKLLCYAGLWAIAMVGPLTAQRRCLLSGVVVDALTNQTLAKAVVFVDLEDSSSLPVRQVTSGEGKFCFENLTPGNYIVRAEHARYVDTNYGERRPGGSGDLLQLNGRMPMTLPAIKMTPEAVISGGVVDEDGDVVKGARIRLLKRKWNKGQPEASEIQDLATDDQGNYRFSGLTAGTYFLRAAPAPGGDRPFPTNFLGQDGQPLQEREANTYYQDSISFAGAAPIKVKAGQELERLDLTIMKIKARHISGQVAADILNTSLRILLLVEKSSNEDSLSVAVIPIHNDGSFRAEGLSPSLYTLRGAGVQQKVDLTNGNIDDLIFEIVRLVEVQIATHPDETRSSQCAAIHGLDLAADTGQISNAALAGTAVENKFLALVSPGTYTVKIPAGGPPCFVQRIVVGGVPQAQRTVEIVKGTRTAIDVYLSARYASVDGHVEQSSPSRRLATIVLQDETAPNSEHRKPASPDGSFTWPVLAPGKYRLFAFDDFDQDTWSDPAMATLLAAKSREIEVKEGEQGHIALPLISFEEFQEAAQKADF